MQALDPDIALLGMISRRRYRDDIIPNSARKKAGFKADFIIAVDINRVEIKMTPAAGVSKD